LSGNASTLHLQIGERVHDLHLQVGERVHDPLGRWPVELRDRDLDGVGVKGWHV
jgi:hypothetical protein